MINSTINSTHLYLSGYVKFHKQASKNKNTLMSEIIMGSGNVSVDTINDMEFLAVMSLKYVC